MYVVVPVFVVLMVAGLQVPVIAGLLLELAGNVGGVEFRHNGPILVKEGVISEFTVIFMVVLLPHWPGFGLKVYVVVPVLVVLIVDGFQVRVMGGLFLELVGSTGGVEFKHTGLI